MAKCKNVECDNETTVKRIYCSLACRNYYVNKYLRNYDKIKETNKNKRKEKEEQYYKNPTYCKQCNKKLTYKRSDGKFCNNSCAATYNDSNRIQKVEYSKQALENLRLVAGANSLKISVEEYKQLKLDYKKNPARCLNCGKEFEYTKRHRKNCSKKCLKETKRKKRDKYQLYRSDCSFEFSLNEYPEEFDFLLIEKYGWYSPNTSNKPNLEGVSRDHIYPVKKGFENDIDPKLIAHPANCQLLKHSDNIGKGAKIKEDDYLQLLKRIEDWNKKYN